MGIPSSSALSVRPFKERKSGAERGELSAGDKKQKQELARYLASSNSAKQGSKKSKQAEEEETEEEEATSDQSATATPTLTRSPPLPRSGFNHDSLPANFRLSFSPLLHLRLPCNQRRRKKKYFVAGWLVRYSFIEGQIA